MTTERWPHGWMIGKIVAQDDLSVTFQLFLLKVHLEQVMINHITSAFFICKEFCVIGDFPNITTDSTLLTA